jgi:hypothetical protein
MRFEVMTFADPSREGQWVAMTTVPVPVFAGELGRLVMEPVHCSGRSRLEAIEALRAHVGDLLSRLPNVEVGGVEMGRRTTDDFIIEELPYGAPFSICAEGETRVFYVNTALQINSYVIADGLSSGGRGRWYPNFRVDNVDDEMLALLKRALLDNCPEARTLRHVRMREGTFFLYAM